MDFQRTKKHIQKVTARTVFLFNTPFGLFDKDNNRLIIAFGISGFAWFFLFTFGVFDFDYFSLSDRLFYTAIYSLSCLIILLMDLFLLRDYLIKKTTMAGACVWGLWIMCCISLSNYLLTTLYFKWEEFSIYVLMKNQLYVLGIGLFITPALILINHNYILRSRILEVMNERLKNNLMDINPLSKEIITINSRYKDGIYETDINKLRYIQASDNYIDICYKNNSSIDHKLVRNTLNEVEKSITHPALIRCHRSYIINMKHVRAVNRNAGHYKIILENIDFEIPVSRKYKHTLFLSLSKDIVVRP